LNYGQKKFGKILSLHWNLSDQAVPGIAPSASIRE